MEDNYAATLVARTFQPLTALIVAFDLEAHHFDAVTAFTNSPLAKVIYCNISEGLDRSEDCLRLQRARYSLRQSPRLWLREFGNVLMELGLQPVNGMKCLFRND